MPITVQTEVFGDLRNLSKKVKGPEVVAELAQVVSLKLAEVSPKDTGLLQRTISETAGPEPIEQGWWAGVGNLEGIYPLVSAPRGTIAAFLIRIGKKKPLASFGRYGAVAIAQKKKKAAGTGFNPKRAWWYLSEDEKQQLRAMREAGYKDVGGASPYKPFYWYIQETGMEEVGIGKKGYIEKTIGVIKGQIQQVISRVLGNV